MTDEYVLVMHMPDGTDELSCASYDIKSTGIKAHSHRELTQYVMTSRYHIYHISEVEVTEFPEVRIIKEGDTE